MEQTKTRNYLPVDKVLQLNKYLEGARKDIEGSGMTHAQIAERCHGALGFIVTVPNATHMIHALGIQPKAPRKPRTRKTDDMKRAMVLIARAVHQHAPTPGTFEALHILLGDDTKLFDVIDT